MTAMVRCTIKFTSRCVNYQPRPLCNLHTGSYDRGHEATALHSPHQAQTRRDRYLATEPPQRNLVEFISDLSSRLDTPRVARLKQDRVQSSEFIRARVQANRLG